MVVKAKIHSPPCHTQRKARGHPSVRKVPLDRQASRIAEDGDQSCAGFKHPGNRATRQSVDYLERQIIHKSVIVLLISGAVAIL